MFARYIEKNYYKFTLFAAQEATSGSSHQWSDWCGAIPTILSPRVSGDLRHSVSNFRKVAPVLNRREGAARCSGRGTVYSLL